MHRSMLFLILPVVLLGCKKKEVASTCHVNLPAEKIELQLSHMVDSVAFAFNSDYIDDFGNTYQFTRAEWYLRVSGFLEADNSTLMTNEDRYCLIDPSVSAVTFDSVSADEYHYLQWGVGVDSAFNHLDPNTFALGEALGNQSPSMHWGWSSGYIFCVMEGLVDIDGNGTYDSGEYFALHVGVDTNYRNGANLLVNAVVPSNGTGTVLLKVNYAAFVDGIDLSIENSTHTMDNMPLAVKVADNFGLVLDLQ
ncbi:MAG: hypothetical protein JKY54_03260 [Flavobacteriales bacterium]|nr:hypothetical protein [Flavobacteriales bacterium]